MSDLAKINHDLDRLNRGVAMYRRAAGRGVGFAVAKQSSELGMNLAKEAKTLMPAKGAITAERLAALKAGEGLRIRQTTLNWIADKYHPVTSVANGQTFMSMRAGKRNRGKVIGMATYVVDPKTGQALSLQALAVQRELAVRESGRGFLSLSERLALAMRNVETPANQVKDSSVSRYGPPLGKFAFTASEKNATATFTWGGFSALSDEAVKAMGRARGMAAIDRAINATIDNLVPYVQRKLGEDAVASFK